MLPSGNENVIRKMIYSENTYFRLFSGWRVGGLGRNGELDWFPVAYSLK